MKKKDQNNILLNKLKMALTEPIEKECQIVYIMVEIRKIMEKRKTKEYPLIYFYCNWVVHEKINKTSPADKILEEIENHYRKGGDGLKEINFISFEQLRIDMKAFISSLEIPTELFDIENKWQIFRDKLAQVLVDCRLEPKDRIIKEIVYKMPDLSMENICWEIEIVTKTKIQTKRFSGSFSDLTNIFSS